MNNPRGPIKQVISKGKKVKNFEIESLILSDTIHAPQNKFTAKK